MINLTKSVFSSRAFAIALNDASSHTRPNAETVRRWFTMKANDGEGEIVIYGEIGKSWWDDTAMSAADFDKELKAMGDVTTINVRINSPGGDAFDGIAIHNMLRNHKAKVNVTVDGIAASAASIIAMAGDTITMPQNAFLLIHGASAIVIGNQADMQSMADDLKRLDASIVNTYATRSGADEKKIAAIMKEDRLMDAAEAKELGLADEVKDPIKMAAKFPLRLLPKAVADKFKASAEVVEETPTEPAPPPAPEGGAPEGSSEPSAPSNVVQLQTTAKKEGRDEMRAYVKQVHELCGLAGFSNMAIDFIAKDKSLDDVRAALVKAKADKEDDKSVNPHHTPPETKPASASWAKAFTRIGAKMKGAK